MKKFFKPENWDHPIMFLVFLVLALVPTAFVLSRVFAAVGASSAAQALSAPFGVAC